MDLDFNYRRKPYDHQYVGLEALVRLDDPQSGRIIPGCFYIADEMGAGKTKQAIDAAQILFVKDLIHRVIVLAPNPVKDVWIDHEMGELRKHLWEDIDNIITEYHTSIREWSTGPGKGKALRWIISNYEFVRSSERLKALLPYIDKGTLLICDEASALKNYKAKQTRATLAIRRKCGRVVLLNGTPIIQSPLDIYSQAMIMAPTKGFGSQILGYKNYYLFRSAHANMGGWNDRQILGYKGLELIQQRMKPYVLRRLKKDCLDLPEKLEPVTIPVTLTEKTWAAYKQMRKELVLWFGAQSVSVAPQAATKVMRLAQICAGFLGGLKDPDTVELESPLSKEDPDVGDRPPWLDTIVEQKIMHKVKIQQPIVFEEEGEEIEGVRIIGSEKLDFTLDWLARRLEEEQNIKLMVWCRFRAEAIRLHRMITERYTGKVSIGLVLGGQTKNERRETLLLLKPGFAPEGPVFGVGTSSSGSMGLDMSAAWYSLYSSNGTGLKDRLQTDDRMHRPGQTHHVWYGDLMAVGPQGQKTIDHTLLKRLREKEDLATWTCSAWVQALREEIDNP